MEEHQGGLGSAQRRHSCVIRPVQNLIRLTADRFSYSTEQATDCGNLRKNPVEVGYPVSG